MVRPCPVAKDPVWHQGCFFIYNKGRLRRRIEEKDKIYGKYIIHHPQWSQPSGVVVDVLVVALVIAAPYGYERLIPCWPSPFLCSRSKRLIGKFYCPLILTAFMDRDICIASSVNIIFGWSLSRTRTCVAPTARRSLPILRTTVTKGEKKQ